MAKVSQGSHDPIVSPAGALSGDTYDPGFGFTIDGRSAPMMGQNYEDKQD
jgi:hypothetical protein